MKRLICAPEVPASQMVLTIITDEQLEAFADAVITKYQQNIARRKAAEKPQEEWMTRKEVIYQSLLPPGPGSFSRIARIYSSTKASWAALSNTLDSSC